MKMARTNKEIVLEFYSAVMNGKKLDRVGDLFSADYVGHSATYIGAGIKIDNSSGERIVVLGTMPGSSANGKVMAGDQIVWASDGKDTWDTFKKLDESSWGIGTAGSSFSLRVLRGGETLEFKLTRGFIEGMTWALSEQLEGLRYWQTKLCPDHQVTIQHILADGDLVSVFTSNKGTFTNYKRQAVWESFDLWRLKDGKIVESWGVEDTLNQQKQLGYRIEPPAV
jgi:predicted SnoaL-like aldol condensation-catalyzing enzyme